MVNIGKAIKLCRTYRNLNQRELAELAGISVSYLSLLERGKRDPNFSVVQSLSKALNVPTSILIFMGSDKSETSEFSPELNEKLSALILRLIEASN